MTNGKLLEIALYGYLPYGAEVCTALRSQRYKIAWDSPRVIRRTLDIGAGYKLMLRPISCLTKPITVPNYNDGEEFVPIDEINRLARLSDEINFDIEWDDDDNHFVLNCAFGLGGWELPFIYDLLNKWLIDWRDLIGKGLAVSIID